MTIELNHTIVPAGNKVTSAKFFAKLFGLSFDEGAVGYFAPVRVNETLTLDSTKLYAGPALLTVLTLAGVAILGFWLSRAGEPLFGGRAET